MHHRSGERSRWVSRLFTMALLLTTLAILLLAFVGSFYYTSMGVDLEADEGDNVRCTYYRIRWPGDGSLWLGGGEHYRPLRLRPLCPFDPASSAFRKPEHFPEALTFWNRLGFWWIVDPVSDPCNKHGHPKLTWGFWFGIPAWLPAVFTGLWWWRRRSLPYHAAGMGEQQVI